MNRCKETFTILKEDYSYQEIGKALLTGFIFFSFPVLLGIGVLIVVGTIYPYWNIELVIAGSILVFFYGVWTNKIILETLMHYQTRSFKDLSFFAYLMQFLLFLAIILVDILIITTIF